MDKEVVLGGHHLKLTNFEKIFWPHQKITKGDLLIYYQNIAQDILPYLHNRPQSLNRFPNGVEGGSFYQKNVETAPAWVKTERVWSDGNQEYINYVICNDEATLLYLINLGCIDLNIWNSRLGTLNNPDFLVLDLDPEDIEFEAVLLVAQEINRIFQKLKCQTYVKTSGASGLHIFLPLKPRYTYDQVKELARAIALLVNKKLPTISSLERLPGKRQGKVYIDYLQNRQGATMASIFSVRPRAEANISMPVTWQEVKSGLCPENFPFPEAQKEVEKRKKIFLPLLLGEGYELEMVIAGLEKLG